MILLHIVRHKRINAKRKNCRIAFYCACVCDAPLFYCEANSNYQRRKALEPSRLPQAPSAAQTFFIFYVLIPVYCHLHLDRSHM